MPAGDTVDLKTTSDTHSIGAPEPIGSFTDPDFGPRLRAFCHLRAVEIRTPRWTPYDAMKYRVKMDPKVPMVQQERAVSSPIWCGPG